MELQEYLDGLGLEYTAEFVPQSKSRNADQDQRSINWNVMLRKGSVTLRADYMQGIGHIPGYQHKMRKTLADAEREGQAAENGVYSRNQHHFMARKLPEPELADVLYSLLMDSEALEYACFEDWAHTFGYDSDSREAERIYKACLEQALILRQMIDLDAARDAFEDY